MDLSHMVKSQRGQGTHPRSYGYEVAEAGLNLDPLILYVTPPPPHHLRWTTHHGCGQG